MLAEGLALNSAAQHIPASRHSNINYTRVSPHLLRRASPLQEMFKCIYTSSNFEMLYFRRLGFLTWHSIVFQISHRYALHFNTQVQLFVSFYKCAEIFWHNFCISRRINGINWSGTHHSSLCKTSYASFTSSVKFRRLRNPSYQSSLNINHY